MENFEMPRNNLQEHLALYNSMQKRVNNTNTVSKSGFTFKKTKLPNSPLCDSFANSSLTCKNLSSQYSCTSKPSNVSCNQHLQNLEPTHLKTSTSSPNQSFISSLPNYLADKSNLPEKNSFQNKLSTKRHHQSSQQLKQGKKSTQKITSFFQEKPKEGKAESVHARHGIARFDQSAESTKAVPLARVKPHAVVSPSASSLSDNMPTDGLESPVQRRKKSRLMILSDDDDDDGWGIDDDHDIPIVDDLTADVPSLNNISSVYNGHHTSPTKDIDASTIVYDTCNTNISSTPKQQFLLLNKSSLNKTPTENVLIDDIVNHPLIQIMTCPSTKEQTEEYLQNLDQLHVTVLKQVCSLVAGVNDKYLLAVPGLNGKMLVEWLAVHRKIAGLIHKAKVSCEKYKNNHTEVTPLDCMTNMRTNHSGYLAGHFPKNVRKSNIVSQVVAEKKSSNEGERSSEITCRGVLAKPVKTTLPDVRTSSPFINMTVQRDAHTDSNADSIPSDDDLFIEDDDDDELLSALNSQAIENGGSCEDVADCIDSSLFQQLPLHTASAPKSNMDVANTTPSGSSLHRQPFNAAKHEMSSVSASTSKSSASECGGQSRPKKLFRGNYRDDGSSGQFDGLGFPHSAEMLKIFRSVFGLKTFRTNQLQAINAALLGEDTFILMPTGGGKSLCYQLPALMTLGVTIVVSPLRSLIQDQVQKLCSLDIPATHLSGDIATQESDGIYRQLAMRDPVIKLLYVTPEKLSASNKLLTTIGNLYSRKLLSRFVIDEAHCVSNWGHDFRPDYKKLNALRQRFPEVPMMALTATATPRVRQDILHQLGMKQPKWFMQSFNRPNLQYEVRPKKPKKLAQDILEMVQKEFKNQSGIIYCLSRNECDKLAGDLSRSGVSALAYHAGLDNDQRNRVQKQWINEDRCKVVCATIAFGMGIDKPDVRYVIHYSLPKSIEGYYQESGRAGRDGLPSRCILFYTYQDMHRIRRMIERDDTTDREAKNVHIDNLYRIVGYCENCTDCRRAQQLEYFGEIFDRRLCKINPKTQCDNCKAEGSFITRDMTEAAKLVIQSVQQALENRPGQRTGKWQKRYTLLHFVEVFRGSSSAKIQEDGHSGLPAFGIGKSYPRSDAERFLRKLVLDDILGEDIVVTAQDFVCAYVKLGYRAYDTLNGRLKVMFNASSGKQSVTVDNQPKTKADKDKEQVYSACYNELVVRARSLALELGMNWKNIYGPDTLKEMCQRLPVTEEEMKEITGVTEHNYQRYGCKFLEITQNYDDLLTLLTEDDFDNAANEVDDVNEDFSSPYFPTRHSSTVVTNGSAANKSRKSWTSKYKKPKRQKTTTVTGVKKKYNARKKFAKQSIASNNFSNSARTSINGASNSKFSKFSRTSITGSKTPCTKSGLGLMPDPTVKRTKNPRSFLSNHPSFQFM